MSMTHNDTERKEEQHLQEHGIRPTSVRILIWRTLQRKRQAFSLNDIEEALPIMDRSSIFRTLRLFAEKRLIHEIDDGTGSCKYCLCRCEEDMHLNHVHFNCIKCGKTFCLQDITIPRVTIPDGFEMQTAEYVIKGICKDCTL